MLESTSKKNHHIRILDKLENERGSFRKQLKRTVKVAVNNGILILLFFPLWTVILSCYYINLQRVVLTSIQMTTSSNDTPH